MVKRVVLTGAAGLVGQNLTPLLRSAGVAVVALDKHRGNLELLARLNPGTEAHAVDLAEPGEWVALFAGAEAVVDLKAQIMAVREEPYRRNNVGAQERVLEACRAHAIPHLVHLSSSVVISVAQDGYSESKRRGEALVRESGRPFTILRPPLLYGCLDVKHLGYIVGLLERTPLLPIPGSGRYLRQPLYVRDLCRVILRCLERGPSGAAHNVIGHERIDFIDLIRLMARARGLRRLVVPVPLPLFTAALRLHAVVTRRPAFNAEQLAALMAGDEFPVEPWTETFGVSYTPFREALREMAGSPLCRHVREMTRPH
jgi:nucleoside-diphosphate-sugar epimerase